MEENPYSTPESELLVEDVKENYELANRSTRLGAAIIDSFILILIFIPIGMLSGLFDYKNPKTDFASQALLAVLGAIIYLVINGKFLLSNGQTVGKKLLGIKVVNADTYEIPGAGDIIGKRYLIFYIIGQIPLASIVNLIDALMIFRKSKKCLHDDIANTIVVKTVS